MYTNTTLWLPACTMDQHRKVKMNAFSVSHSIQNRSYFISFHFIFHHRFNFKQHEWIENWKHLICWGFFVHFINSFHKYMYIVQFIDIIRKLNCPLKLEILQIFGNHSWSISREKKVVWAAKCRNKNHLIPFHFCS